ncbi:helix-turn-helix domain-containing protein [Methylomonas methanica]|uniref:Helix-turn-helix domain protein n=1 Tax=Methylomonas methanica (strain DSM 25384 / MC09) TaxID=857087 RepID=G0A4K8_METMM|nr:helix-turn-helix transcriptional regulator [Methylomonas methanica]AEG01599.1 helix-turn-helix domain protein [Methylomonas methanica MC09]
MNISKALKLCRTQKGITKTKLAEKADMSVSYLSLLEQGKRDPNMSTINKICVALNIPASIFMFLASDINELDGISKELAEKISLTALQLMEPDVDKADLPS